MRYAKTAILALLIVPHVACGESPAPQVDTRQQEAPPTQQHAPPEPDAPEPEPEPEPSPFAHVPEAELEVHPEWLVVRGVMGERGPMLGIGDAEKVDRFRFFELENPINSYLARQSDDAGLPGLDPDAEWQSVSRNPVVFECAAGESTNVFHAFLSRLRTEHVMAELVLALRHADGVRYLRYSQQPDPRMLVEPPAPSAEPDMEFPDEVDPESDDSGSDFEESLAQFHRVTLKVLPVYDRNKEAYGFRTVWESESVDHRATGFRPANLAGEGGRLDDAAYKQLRTRLAEAVLERLQQTGDAVQVIEVSVFGECVSTTGAPEDKSVPWVVLFAQVDAARVVTSSGHASAELQLALR